MPKKDKKSKKDNFPRLTKKWKPSDEFKDVPNIFKSKFLNLKGKVGSRGIRDMCDLGVVEVEFKRRIWPIKNPDSGQKTKTRRMLASSAFTYINKNKKIYKFVPPSGKFSRSLAWYKKKKLIIVWDMVRKKFRHISLDDYNVISFWPLVSRRQKKTFEEKYQLMWDVKTKSKLLKYFNVN
jgi:hypothetical protein